MIKVTVGQMKSGIILTFEDTTQDEWTRSVRLNWREAAGLKHALNDALDNPLWTERDPRSDKKEIRYGNQ